MAIDYSVLMRPWHEQYGSEHPPGPNSDLDVEFYQNIIARAHKTATEQLRRDLIRHVLLQNANFFEDLVVDLLLAAGYGCSQREKSHRLGRSGDGGVDGVIAQDELGLDLIYIQAKRYKPAMPVRANEMRDFLGALQAHHVHRGVFVTTSRFTRAACAVVERVPLRVALIDQSKLADLMIRHNLGVNTQYSYDLKTVDKAYFSRRPACLPKREPRLGTLSHGFSKCSP